MIPWNLTGTDRQIAVAREAFNRIKFPFGRLTLPGTPELGWMNLNSGTAWAAKGAKLHEGKRHGVDSLEGEINGRRATLGAIWPDTGRIVVDVSLESQPELAMAVIGAEIAHAVDFFLPMTDAMRNEFLRLWNVEGSTWWEVADYSAEYFRLGGEAFMDEFVKAYSDLDLGSTGAFIHDAGVEAADVRRILGIERTDFVKPNPKTFLVYGKSKIYHVPGHYKNKTNGVPVVSTTSLRACLLCRPK